jgi:hypothetical protein
MLVQLLMKRIISRRESSNMGEFLPLSVWATRGFDIKKIVDNSRAEDIKEDPRGVLGSLYRVYTQSNTDSNIEEDAREQVLKKFQEHRTDPNRHTKDTARSVGIGRTEGSRSPGGRSRSACRGSDRAPEGAHDRSPPEGAHDRSPGIPCDRSADNVHDRSPGIRRDRSHSRRRDRSPEVRRGRSQSGRRVRSPEKRRRDRSQSGRRRGRSQSRHRRNRSQSGRRGSSGARSRSPRRGDGGGGRRSERSVEKDHKEQERKAEKDRKERDRKDEKGRKERDRKDEKERRERDQVLQKAITKKRLEVKTLATKAVSVLSPVQLSLETARSKYTDKRIPKSQIDRAKSALKRVTEMYAQAAERLADSSVPCPFDVEAIKAAALEGSQSVKALDDFAVYLAKHGTN